MSTGNSPYSPDPNSNHSIYTQYVVPLGDQNPLIYTYRMEAPIQCPKLVILDEPQSKFRFRYKSEMTGTHGSIMAESNDRNRKSPVRVQLQNYIFGRPVTVRCSLVTNPSDNTVPIPHVHKLVGDGKDEDECFQDVSDSVNWTATFQGITIIHTAKKQVKDVLAERLSRDKLLELQSEDPSITQLTKTQKVQVNDNAENLGSSIDLHSVRLKFEAFYKDCSPMQLVCPPVYSTPISNLKCTQAGDLRIVRIDKIVSCCTGNEEVFIFVEKVNKRNIKIRFFEQNSEGVNTWEAWADFSELDVHHQYAIVFRTPPYKDLNIKDDVDVMLELYRPSDAAVSEAKAFKYKPQEHVQRSLRLPIGKRSPQSPPSYDRSEKQPKRSPGSFSDTSNVNSPNGMEGDSSNGPLDQGEGPQAGRNVLHPSQWSFQQPVHANWNFPVTAIQQHTQPNRVPFMQPRGVDHPSTSMQPSLQFPIQHVQHRPLNQPPVSAQTESSYTQQPYVLQPASNQGYQVLQTVAPFPSIPQTTMETVSLAEDLEDLLKNFCTDSVKKEDYGGEFSLQEFNVNADQFSNFLSFEQLATDAVKSKVSSDSPALTQGKSQETNADVDTISDAFGSISLEGEKKGVPGKVEDDKEGIDPEVTQTTSLHMAQALSLNMAYALRYYACTGNLSVLLNRMHHLLAIQSEDGDNALHASLVNYQTEAFRLILQAALSDKNGQEMISAPNDKGQTPLHVAVLTNHPEAVRALLHAGANLDAKDNNGNTAFHSAAADPHLLDCLASLLEPQKKKSLNVFNSIDGMTPLHLAVRSATLNAVQMLCRAKADVNTRELKQGRTALEMAIERNCPDIVNYLLNSTNVDVNIQAYDGTTALHLAILARQAKLVSKLMSKGANPMLRRIQVELDSEGDSEDDNDEEPEERGGAEEEDSDEEVTTRGQTAWNMAQSEPTVLAAMQADYSLVQTEVVEEPVKIEKSWQLGQTKQLGDKQPDPMDSGVDLMSSRDLTSKCDLSVLPSDTVEKVASLIDPPETWKLVSKALNLDQETSLVSQPSPGKYLLNNLEELGLSFDVFVQKLHELKLKSAADLLENAVNL